MKGKFGMEIPVNLECIPKGIGGLLQVVAKLSVILGPDWHFNSEESHVSWRFQETEDFPVAIDFTDPVSVQMFDLTGSEDDCDPAIVEKITAVAAWCERTGIPYGYEQA
jgi:hypothetical protein